MATVGAALRLRLLYRMLRVGELLALVAFLSWSSSRVPSAAAALLRLAGSLLLNARFVFVLGNAIVLLLLALSRHDLSASSSSNPTSTDNNAAATPTPPQAAPPAASASFPSSFATSAPTASSSLLEEEAASFAMPIQPAPEVVVIAAPAPEPAHAAATAMAFEDKAAVRVSSKLARAPRRSRSEKAMGQRVAARRAVSPELRRSESENGRRRRSSVTARDAQAARWGMDDADEFRRTVEAFIAKQTRFFHREESMGVAGGGHCGDAPAIAGALAVVE